MPNILTAKQLTDFATLYLVLRPYQAKRIPLCDWTPLNYFVDALDQCFIRSGNASLLEGTEIEKEYYELLLHGESILRSQNNGSEIIWDTYGNKHATTDEIYYLSSTEIYVKTSIGELQKKLIECANFYSTILLPDGIVSYPPNFNEFRQLHLKNREARQAVQAEKQRKKNLLRQSLSKPVFENDLLLVKSFLLTHTYDQDCCSEYKLGLNTKNNNANVVLAAYLASLPVCDQALLMEVSKKTASYNDCQKALFESHKREFIQNSAHAYHGSPSLCTTQMVFNTKEPSSQENRTAQNDGAQP